MKKMTYLLTALLAIGFTATKAQTSVQPQVLQPQIAPAPKDVAKVLAFTNDNYDFGKIPAGKPTEYQVSIKNISSDTVTLKNVQVGCGCTTPKYDKDKRFGPGETITVTLGFSGNANGTFTKAVTLFFNDDVSKQVTFKGDAFQVPENAAPANTTTQKMKAN